MNSLRLHIFYLFFKRVDVVEEKENELKIILSLLIVDCRINIRISFEGENQAVGGFGIWGEDRRGMRW